MSKTLPRRPWKGRKYSGLLILGEAHHGLSPEGDDAMASIRFIEQTIGGWRHPFYTKVAQVVTGSSAAQIDRQAFWPTVAFHNFIQTSVKRARVRPTRKQWEVGHEHFPAVLQQLKPTHILVLGKDLMENMPPFDAAPPPPISGGDKTTLLDQVGLYHSGGENFALAMWIKHPSSPGFSPTKWRPLVRAFLEVPATPDR
jgi:hypothetical protein